jgi:hypothetical protein
MKGRAFEESHDPYEDDEVPDQAGFDLRNKSLTNTARREAEPRKTALPLKSIMKEILDKPVSENTQKVAQSLNPEIHSVFQEEGHPEEGRERKEKRETRGHQEPYQEKSPAPGQGAAEL